MNWQTAPQVVVIAVLGAACGVACAGKVEKGHGKDAGGVGDGTSSAGRGAGARGGFSGRSGSGGNAGVSGSAGSDAAAGNGGTGASGGVAGSGAGALGGSIESCRDGGPAPGFSTAVEEKCTWGDAQRISDESSFGAVSHSLGVAPGGDVVVAYDGLDASLWTTAFSGGTWNAASRYPATRALEQPWRPWVVTAGDARAILMWQFDRVETSIGPVNASAWSQPSIVAPSAEPTHVRSLVGLADGRAALTWRSLTDHAIWVAQLNAAGVWGAPYLLGAGSSGPTPNPTIAADPAGNLAVTWGAERAWVTTFDVTSGSWSKPYDLGPVEVNGGASEVAFVAPGRPMVAWPTLAHRPQQIMVARWEPDADAGIWNTFALATLNSDAYVAGYDGIRIQANERGDAVVSWRLYHSGVDSHGELWVALYQNGQWRCPQPLVKDGDPSQDIALTREGDVVVVTTHYVRPSWHASALRYRRQLDGWSPAHVLAHDAGSSRVGVDADGNATAIYGESGALWAARQTCQK